MARYPARIPLADWVIEGRVGPGGTRAYRAHIYYRGRDVASPTFQRKRDAQEWERRQTDSLRSGVWSDPAAGDRPVAEWLNLVLVKIRRDPHVTTVGRFLCGRGWVPGWRYGVV
jgi:hypothetical protein